MSKSTGATGLRWLWLALVILVVDLGTKQWVMTHFQLGESLPLIPFFSFTYAHNYGAAFSFLADKGGWQRWFFALIAFAVIISLLVIMYRTRASQKAANIAYALIIGGAIGNLSDRLIHGYVIDFMDFFIGNWHYPTFNLADCAIVIGAFLVVVESFFSSPDKKTASGE
ncbi:signal peptidase II [Musicola paradisiaca]|uniref:Lipoprotein signal peptidase n=1 Tax=Musicola paradisiaca (strain Ech703) TaxID=579405 RepID=C6C9E8_MUSP7|nr:signal peptidase II [Musicola paradisiaca]ACS84399.1 lipoprotein signal peptidase [Musicola paradisiaca Ech703]